MATSHAGPSDNQTLENLQAAVLKLESGNSFDTSDAVARKTASMTGTKFQNSFKITERPSPAGDTPLLRHVL